MRGIAVSLTLLQCNASVLCELGAAARCGRLMSNSSGIAKIVRYIIIEKSCRYEIIAACRVTSTLSAASPEEALGSQICGRDCTAGLDADTWVANSACARAVLRVSMAC